MEAVVHESLGDVFFSHVRNLFKVIYIENYFVSHSAIFALVQDVVR